MTPPNTKVILTGRDVTMGIESKLYHYRAIITKIVDGDTVKAEVDWGRNQWSKNVRLRLLGIQCPEKKGKTKKEGLKAEAFTKSLLQPGQEVIIRTQKDDDSDDDFGRLLAEIYLLDGKDTSVNRLLLESGNAVVFMD